MTARTSFTRLIQAGKEVVRDIFKRYQGTKVKTPCQVSQHQKDVHHQVSHQAPQFIRSNSTLFSKIIPRVYYQSLASELRRQAAQRSWGRGSSPLFAFAGLAVLSSFRKEEDIVMDQIREMGKTSQEYKSNFQMGQFPCLSLDSFQLGQMIGKGCYAVVYEARLKVQSTTASEENVIKKTSEGDSDIVMIDQLESDKSDPESRSDTDSDSDIIMLDQSESDTESIDIISDKSDPEPKGETDSDSDIIVIGESESDTDSIEIISDKPDPEFKGDSIVPDQSVSAPVEFTEVDVLGLTEFRTSLSSEAVAADDHLHDLNLSLDQNSFVILSQSDRGENAGHFEHETAPPEYNLAIKIMYNYQIESKASAIKREMEKEMVPAKLEATQAQMKEWENGNKVRKKSLPQHPNIVSMWGVFVDPFPQLPEGKEHYPAALPKRLNPDGIGRNQTLFLVMKKEEVILDNILYSCVPYQTLEYILAKCDNLHPVRQKYFDVQSLKQHDDDIPQDKFFRSLSVHPAVNIASRMQHQWEDGIKITFQWYDMNLHQYLQTRQPDIRTRILLLAQLLEGVVHMGKYGIAHRDMKNDNILLDCSTGEIPQLVIGDFGCCLADSQNGLKLPYPTEEVDRGGNSALMAPEISNALPGPNHFLDYSKSDLWSVGALAYEIFGEDNPFYSRKGRKNLDSRTYRESDLPLLPDSVPLEVRKLVLSLLQRDPGKRPTPEVAADALSLYLWAPSHWWLPGNKVRSQVVRWWLAILAVEVSILRLSQSEFTPEFYLKASFLSHFCMENMQAAIVLMQTMG